MSGPRSIEVYPREDRAEVAMEQYSPLALNLGATAISRAELLLGWKTSLPVLIPAFPCFRKPILAR
jgi:hypothetical protein